MTFEFQWVSTASVENSSRGISIRCSLFGDQKLWKVACPDSTAFTSPAYHHSSANGTFTPLIRMKERAKSAAITQNSAASSTGLPGRGYVDRVKSLVLA